MPFGIDQPEKVAQNLAGLQAVNSSIGIVAMMRGAISPQDVNNRVLEVLTDISTGRLTSVEQSVVLRTANATWGAGQPYRADKGPLGRADRMNVFDLLDQKAVAKDWHQIKAAADWLLTLLEV